MGSLATNIKCNTHNRYFDATSGEHIRGGGRCPDCVKENGLWTLAKVLNKHPHYEDLWDYSESKFPLKPNEMITVRCKRHNTLATHSMKHHVHNKPACHKCISEANSKPRVTTQEFKERASKIHSDFYDYSKSEYTGRHKKLTIICPLHGEFKQTAGNHLNGQGCWECRNRKISEQAKNTHHINDSNRLDASVLYLIRFYSGSNCYYKVGITRRSIEKRFTSEPAVDRYDLLMEFNGTYEDVVIMENAIMGEIEERGIRYKCQELKGRMNGWTECVRESDFDLSYIISAIF